LALLVGVWTALFTLGALYLADDKVSFAFERSLETRLERIEAGLRPGGGETGEALTTRLDGLEGEIKSIGATVGDVATTLQGAVAKLDDAIARMDKAAPQDTMPATKAAATMAPMPPVAPVTTAAMDGPAALVLTIDFLNVGSFDGPWLDGVVATTASRLTETAAGRDGCAVQATGHADTVGRDGANQTLALKRAATVTQRLQKALPDGISVKPAVAWGERRLAVLTGDNVNERANRRVEVVLRCGASNMQS